MDLCNNDHAIMDVNFVQIGLALASIMFIIAGYMLVYENPLQAASEIESVAEDIESMIAQVDAQWFEHQLVFLFPESYLLLNAEISPDFIRIRSVDSAHQYSLIPIPQMLWICEPDSSLDNADDFHQMIRDQFQHFATREDPCLMSSNVSNWFQNQYHIHHERYHQDPLIWNRGRALSFEKCILFKEVICGKNKRSIPFLEFIIVKEC